MEALRTAAGEAMAVGAPDVAATYLRRALDGPVEDDVRAGLLLELGSAETARQDPVCVEHLREAMSTTRSAHHRVGAALVLARFLVWSGEVAAARELLRATADEARTLDEELAKLVEAGFLLANIYEAPSEDLSARAQSLLRRVSVGESPADRSALAALSRLAALESDRTQSRRPRGGDRPARHAPVG